MTFNRLHIIIALLFTLFVCSVSADVALNRVYNNQSDDTDTAVSTEQPDNSAQTESSNVSESTENVSTETASTEVSNDDNTGVDNTDNTVSSTESSSSDESDKSGKSDKKKKKSKVAKTSVAQKMSKEADAVQAALAVVLHKYSTQADTIANELSARFNDEADMQTAIARAYFRNNEREKTRRFLDKAFAIDDEFSPAFILKGDMYGEWDVDSACLWFEKAIAVDSLNPIPYVKYATVMSRNDMEKAKAKLEELRLAVPGYNVDIELATLYNKKGMDAEAAAAMESVDPHTLTMNQLIQFVQNCYWSQDDIKCMELCLIGTQRFPDNKGFDRLYFWSATRSGMYAEALEHGKIWFESAKDSVNSVDYFSLGSCYLGLSQLDDAFATYAKIPSCTDYFVPQMDGQIRQTLNRRIDALKAEQRFKEALDLYKIFMEKYPSSDKAYMLYQYAAIYRDWQDALQGDEKLTVIKQMFNVYDQLETEYPNWENLHYVLYTHARWTYAYFDPDNTQCLAEPYYQKLYDYCVSKEEQTDQLKSMEIEACRYLASVAYFTRHDLKTARVWWNRILNIDPEDENAQNALKTIKK